MTIFLRRRGVREERDPESPRAQTGRRGGAGPAGACLAVRTPPAVFDYCTMSTSGQSSFRIVPMPRFLVNSELLLLPNRSR